ncbi:DUF429 domain-containing protein [Niallia endozanthoxylica]|uniref:DUF429 domain-containing protein n=1 Tax=Niallia endozanthoxylica TaxID=2036016 RepID=A0A5J5HQY8_9BACI|nr:DUF429 domain-containing protein [Niallia endozanthoxylica]KAA9023601.1 DUF429 domain-containing protein [Niallia endozanthoxylica]
MIVMGIDLSGPANHKDTAMAVFQTTGDELNLLDRVVHVDDEKILSMILSYTKYEIIIGIDAPLSYQDGGGDRPQDKSLRDFIKSYGLLGSSIMPPTLTKMVYLILRGISLTRRIMQLNDDKKIKIVEVHPGAAIGTRIGPSYLYHALHYKKEIHSRYVILDWFQSVGLKNLPIDIADNTHQMDACAAALAAWHWGDSAKTPVWHWDGVTSAHPFEICC